MDRSTPLRRLVTVPAMALACLVGVPALAQANGSFDIEQQDGLFNVSAENAALSSVITRLSEITEIPMNIAEGQDTQVTLSLNEYSLESLIAELSSSSMIVRKSVDGTDVISEVVFMLGSEGSGVAAASLPSGEPNEGIIAGEEPDELESMLDEELEESEPQTEIQVPGQVDPETGELVAPTE